MMLNDAAPVRRPEVVTLAASLIIIGGSLWLVRTIAGDMARAAQAEPEPLSALLSRLVLYALLVGVFVIRPAVQLLALRDGARHWLISLCWLVVICNGLQVGAAVIAAAIALSHAPQDGLAVAFKGWTWAMVSRLAVWAAIMLVASAIDNALRSPEVKSAFRAAEAGRGPRRTLLTAVYKLLTRGLDEEPGDEAEPRPEAPV